MVLDVALPALARSIVVGDVVTHTDEFLTSVHDGGVSAARRGVVVDQVLAEALAVHFVHVRWQGDAQAHLIGRSTLARTGSETMGV